MGFFYQSPRRRAELQWKYFGRPLIIAFGIAALIGLSIGIVWTVAGLWHFGWLQKALS